MGRNPKIPGRTYMILLNIKLSEQPRLRCSEGSQKKLEISRCLM
jgi:hypothetical protein